MTAVVGYKFTVHFSTSFSTTRTSSRKMFAYCPRAELTTLGLAISLMTSASVVFADCFLVFFLPIFPMMSPVRTDYRSIWITRPLTLLFNCYAFSSFRSSELSSPSEVFFPLAPNERGTTMAFEAILAEVEQLHNVSTRLGDWRGNIRPCQKHS